MLIRQRIRSWRRSLYPAWWERRSMPTPTRSGCRRYRRLDPSSGRRQCNLDPGPRGTSLDHSRSTVSTSASRKCGPFGQSHGSSAFQSTPRDAHRDAQADDEDCLARLLDTQCHLPRTCGPAYPAGECARSCWHPNTERPAPSPPVPSRSAHQGAPKPQPARHPGPRRPPSPDNGRTHHRHELKRRDGPILCSGVRPGVDRQRDRRQRTRRRSRRHRTCMGGVSDAGTLTTGSSAVTAHLRVTFEQFAAATSNTMNPAAIVRMPANAVQPGHRVDPHATGNGPVSIRRALSDHTPATAQFRMDTQAHGSPASSALPTAELRRRVGAGEISSPGQSVGKRRV